MTENIILNRSKKSILLALIALSACTTPTTTLTNNKTGQVVTCGGNTSNSMMLGAVGYYMQKSNDSDCVANYLEQGFKRNSYSAKPSSD